MTYKLFPFFPTLENCIGTVSILEHHYIRCHQNAAYSYINHHVSSSEAQYCICSSATGEKCWYHTAMIQVDFSENYKLTHQDEVQPAQPVVVSPYTSHKIDEILPYMTDIFDKYIANARDIDTVHIFSDGARQQFKSTACMRSIEYLAKTFKVTIHWNYMASYHGKGRSDGIGATTKIAVWKQVKSGQSCQSYVSFAEIATAACPNVCTISWTPQRSRMLDRHYHFSRFLNGTEISKTIKYVVSYHHIYVEYDRTSGTLGKLSYSQVSEYHQAISVNSQESEPEDDCYDFDESTLDSIVTSEEDSDEEYVTTARDPASTSSAAAVGEPSTSHAAPPVRRTWNDLSDESDDDAVIRKQANDTIATHVEDVAQLDVESADDIMNSTPYENVVEGEHASITASSIESTESMESLE